METTAFQAPGSGSLSARSEERRSASVTLPNNMVIGSVFPPSGGNLSRPLPQYHNGPVGMYIDVYMVLVYMYVNIHIQRCM